MCARFVLIQWHGSWIESPCFAKWFLFFRSHFWLFSAFTTNSTGSKTIRSLIQFYDLCVLIHFLTPFHRIASHPFSFLAHHRWFFGRLVISTWEIKSLCMVAFGADDVHHAMRYRMPSATSIDDSYFWYIPACKHRGIRRNAHVLVFVRKLFYANVVQQIILQASMHSERA